MNVYPISQNAGYDGMGLALAAVVNGEAVKIIYLRDICSYYDGEEEVKDWAFWGLNPMVKATAIKLEETGRVSVGMASSWEFVEV